MPTSTWKIPGSFLPGLAFLDIETRKVEAGRSGFVMPSGEILRRRWSAYMVGIARDGKLYVSTDIMTGPSSEQSNLAAVGTILSDEIGIIYSGTRQFDEMILRGRFTNARRRHLPKPEFPAVPGAEDFQWICLANADKTIIVRGPDITSRECATPKSELMDRILLHNIRDVIELVVLAGKPNKTCLIWCGRMLLDAKFAMSFIKKEVL